jgi:2Fe-2S ferredoxin
MPQLVIENLHERVIEVLDSSKSILQLAQAERIDWMHACGGKGRCTTCRVQVLDGMEHLHALTEAEQGFRAKGRLAEDERLSCQVKPTGDLRVYIPDACKFPHLNYSS